MRHHFAARIAAVLLLMLASWSACAQVGLQRETWTVSKPDNTTESMQAIVWYPTAAASRVQHFGPFEVNAAPGAAPSPGRHPLVLISHGTGGNDLAHAWLAERLVSEGYIAVTLRHPGDNFQDRSAVARSDYLTERPKQLSRTLDQLLDDKSRWAQLIDAGRIAAIGHSAGGYSVLALAGGRPDLSRVRAHCVPSGVGLREDAGMCRLRTAPDDSAQAPAPERAESATELPDLRDARIRVVVADSPFGLPFDPQSLRSVTVPVLLSYSTRDEVLAARFHGEPLCKALPRVTRVRSETAGHFALMQAGTGPLGVPPDDPSFDPAGFDRRQWQEQQWELVRKFLAENLI